MNIMAIVIAIAIVGIVGLLISIFLSFSANKFKVDVDEKQEAILEALPGNNCGGCGYPGCSGLAEAIAQGKAPVNGCPVGGKNVADVVAGIMGVEAGEVARKVAFVKCSGNCEVATADFEYTGPKDCRMASMVPGKGYKSCDYGCLGFGTCASVCDSNAIVIVDGIAKVDADKCIGCGKCVNNCPMHLIELIPYDAKYRVACSSQDIGKNVMKACKTGCVGCGLCAKNCEAEAVKVDNNLAKIDYDKCVGCGVCAEKCPKKVIM